MPVRKSGRRLIRQPANQLVQDFVSGTIYQPFDNQYREYYQAEGFDSPPSGTLSISGSEENPPDSVITARIILANDLDDYLTVEGRQGKSRSYQQGIKSVEFKGSSSDASVDGAGYYSLNLFRLG